MEKLAFLEKRKILSKRKSLGTNIGVLDRGLYYLTAIVLKDIDMSGFIIINKQRRDFLDVIYKLTTTPSIYKYLLGKIRTTYTTIGKWKKWVNAFLGEYQRNIDIIITSEVDYAVNILDYQRELITGICMYDAEEEYVDMIQLQNAFDIKEMIDAIESVMSSCIPPTLEPSDE